MKPLKGGKPLKKAPKKMKFDIHQIAQIFPNSEAQAFRYVNHSREMYFLMGEIRKMGKLGDEDNPVTAMVRCLKMDDETKELEETYVTIKALDEIQSIKIIDFYNKAMQNYNMLRLKLEIEKTDKLEKLVHKYEYYSFKRRRKKVQKVSKEPAEVLPS